MDRGGFGVPTLCKTRDEVVRAPCSNLGGLAMLGVPLSWKRYVGGASRYFGEREERRHLHVTSTKRPQRTLAEQRRGWRPHFRRRGEGYSFSFAGSEGRQEQFILLRAGATGRPLFTDNKRVYFWLLVLGRPVGNGHHGWACLVRTGTVAEGGCMQLSLCPSLYSSISTLCSSSCPRRFTFLILVYVPRSLPSRFQPSESTTGVISPSILPMLFFPDLPAVERT